MNLPAQIQEKLNQRQTQAIIVGVLILVVIAVLQMSHNRGTQSMVALFESQQQLCDGDLERMEFAIGKSGIQGCKIDNGVLMVPGHRKEDCLNAISDNHALPRFLRSETNEEPTVNPFLSRTQQKQIEDARKKRLVREMVMRLPFVSNAWFEMDSASGGTVFKPAQQTAVVSIEPPADVLLDPEQVATVREMIAGSIAGLPAANIRVIDVTSGYAYRAQNPNRQTVAIDQRDPYEQETYYRRRIQQAIEPWGDIEVQVRVNQLKAPMPAQQVSHSTPIKVESSSPVLSVMGTNGSASISDFQTPVKSAPVVMRAASVSRPVYTSRVEVTLQVPESAAAQSAGVSSFTAADKVAKQEAINKLGRTLVDNVKPILPVNSFKQGSAFPISVQFVPDATRTPVAAVNWQTKVRQWTAKHWPSAAVLLAGLVLLTVMTRYNSYDIDDDEEVNEDIISINTTNSDAPKQKQPLTQQRQDAAPEVAIAKPEDYAARQAAEKKLGNIVEKDPESAARVIESWIKNAG